MPPKADSAPADDPWFAGGLRFQCTGCGDCCTGAPGYIWVNQGEIDALAARLDMTPAAFERKYVNQIGIRRSLKELPGNYDCVFLDGESRKCTVYEDRPRQCRTWPFWDSNLKNPDAWEECCEACPGAGKGKLYTLEAVQRQASVIHV